MHFPKLPPANFQGLRRDLPVERYDRKLPHLRQDGATYFVTFRLADALPASAGRELKHLRAEFDRLYPPPHDNELVLARAKKLAATEERWLDKGYGACPFHDLELRDVLRDIMMFYDVKDAGTCRYEIGGCTIMPNHVHALVRPFEGCSLDNITQRWKRRSAQQINRHLAQDGSLWFSESYDRIVRDCEHLWRCVQYIGRNGRKAGLKDDAFVRWVRPDWETVGWGFET